MTIDNQNIKGKCKVYFLKHSGVMVETDEFQVFFDVISNISDIIKPEKKQVFLITHGHYDHFDLSIASYKEMKSQFIVSSDITIEKVESLGANVHFMSPDETMEIDSVTIQTFKSTDLGVSFYVALQNCNIFHSGDLNWWHWENTPKATQLDEEKAYKVIIDEVVKKSIDIAFIPMDPRLGIATTWAIDYFKDHNNAKIIVPIHFGDQYKVVRDLTSDMTQNSRLVIPRKENEQLL
jgi:hypothetical protein